MDGGWAFLPPRGVRFRGRTEASVSNSAKAPELQPGAASVAGAAAWPRSWDAAPARQRLGVGGVASEWRPEGQVRAQPGEEVSQVARLVRARGAHAEKHKA